MNPEPLTGKALLVKLFELSSESLPDKALECGYDLDQGDDQWQQFLGAILAAQADGVFLGSTTTNCHIQKAKNGCVSVRPDGSIVFDTSIAQQLGCKPGDELEIKLGRRDFQLKVVGFD